jgi:hypothetical protein
MLNWRSLPYRRDSFFVVGTELSTAIVPGTLSRFAIVEVRARDGDRDPRLHYSVRDASTVSDEDVKAGRSPRHVKWFDEPDQAVAWCLDQI